MDRGGRRLKGEREKEIGREEGEEVSEGRRRDEERKDRERTSEELVSDGFGCSSSGCDSV